MPYNDSDSIFHSGCMAFIDFIVKLLYKQYIIQVNDFNQNSFFSSFINLRIITERWMVRMVPIEFFINGNNLKNDDAIDGQY